MSDLQSRLNTFHQIPAVAELIQLCQWVIWKYVERRDKDGDLKWDKPLFNPHTGYKGSHSNTNHWATYDQAIAAAGKHAAAGLGFVFSECDPYSGIDLDGCRDKSTGVIALWAERIICMCDSYTEISPSETGVKIWVRGTLPEAVKKSFSPHVGIEVYSKQRYFTVTGNHLPGTPLEIREAQCALDLLWAEYKPPLAANAERPTVTHTIERSTSGERVVARDVIDRLNAANDLGTLLESKGATLVRNVGDVRYYSGMDGDAHSHSITYIVSPAKGGGHIGFSYSPNGKLNNVNFRRGFSWFDAICALDYGGVPLSALKALNPIAPRKAKQCFNSTQALTLRRTPEQIVAYNATRTAQRHAETRQALDAIYDAACNLAMTSAVPVGANAEAHADRARLLFAFLITLCSERGVLQVAPTNAQLCADLEIGQRNIVHAFRELEAAGLGRRSGGKGGLGQPNEAATWTFSLSPNLACKPHQDAICTLSNKELDLDLDSDRACEGGAYSTLENVYAESLDTWVWLDDTHGADELMDVLAPAHKLLVAENRHVAERMEPAHTAPDQLLPLIRSHHGRFYVTDSVRYGRWCATEAGAWAAWEPEARAAEQSAEPEIHNTAPDQDAPGASYTPVELPHAPYSGTTIERYLDFESRAQLARESMRLRDQPHVESAETAHFADLSEEEPQVLSPPIEQPARDRYFALRGKARKTTSDKQKYALNTQADAMRIWLPVSEAIAVRRGNARASPARAHRMPALVQEVFL